MLSIRQDPKLPIAWHIGNAIPVVDGRRVVFEADGAELAMILAAMQAASPGSPVLAPPPVTMATPTPAGRRVKFSGTPTVHPPDGINNGCVMYVTDVDGVLWHREMTAFGQWAEWVAEDNPTR